MSTRMAVTVFVASLVAACAPGVASVPSATPSPPRPALPTPAPPTILVPTETSTPTATLTEAPFEFPTDISLPTIETTPSGENFRTLASEECGFRVDFPQDWVALDDSSDTWFQHPAVGECIFGLRPANWSEIQEESEFLLGDTAVVIVVAAARPEAVSDLVFLEGYEGEWFVLGRQAFRAPAEVSDLNGYLLVKGQGAYGLLTKDTSSYGGLGGIWRALLWDRGERTALFEDSFNTEEAFDELLESFAFR